MDVRIAAIPQPLTQAIAIVEQTDRAFFSRLEAPKEVQLCEMLKELL